MSLLVFDSVSSSCLRYKIYDLPNTLYTKPVWKSVNPRIEETVHFAALGVSREFLNYLLTNALIVDLWGLQGTRFTHSVLLCTVQPDLMLQREGREVGGSVEQWVRAIVYQASGFDLVHLSSLGAGQLRLPPLSASLPHCRRLCPPGCLSAGCLAHG